MPLEVIFKEKGWETMNEAKKGERPNCFTCKHFFVSWNPAFPRGCRGLGFKGKEMPSQVVFRSSGMECMMYEEKRRKSKEE